MHGKLPAQATVAEHDFFTVSGVLASETTLNELDDTTKYSLSLSLSGSHRRDTDARATRVTNLVLQAAVLLNNREERIVDFIDLSNVIYYVVLHHNIRRRTMLSV
jgi:hypothetical protein